MAESAEQRLIKRDFRSWMLPRAVLTLLLVNLCWEVIKNNVGAVAKTSWPWRFLLLDLSATATLAGIVATLILARLQLSRSMHPVINWSAYDEPSRYVRNSLWTVHLRNGGPGRALVHSTAYRIRVRRPGTASDSSPPWVDWTEAVAAIEATGVTFRDDFFLLTLRNGASLPPSGLPDAGIEVFAINRRTAARVVEVSMRIQVVDVIGDQYERVITCWLSTEGRGSPYTGGHWTRALARLRRLRARR
ncbi:hypothetical protein [Herbidospora sp. RD11066]